MNKQAHKELNTLNERKMLDNKFNASVLISMNT